MTAQKFLLFAAVAVLSAILARSHPTHVRVVDLSEVLNKTVCPIVVDVDVNMDRVPQRIKVMRCAREPNHWCEAQHIPRHECCQHSHANHQMECVEMRDTVLVYYKSTKKIKTHEVSVGCSCMIEQSTRVPRIPESPT